MAPISKHGARRDRGIRFEFFRMRPHDHMCWVFTYAAVLADAVAHGYAGLRVAAENTSLVSDDELVRFR